MTNTSKKTVMVINGPNLNLLGSREPEVYGRESLKDIEHRLKTHASATPWQVDFRQSNQEGEIIDWIHEARESAQAIIINAGAYTHTSIAIMDALLAVNLPIIEVHLSNIFKREDFRHHSYISPASRGIICGFGSRGYLLALDALADITAQKQ
ncbi:type II 3-dehydroquinate dehydratase [Luteithermobacter gelatinilyticus]|uniref:type II 3-dehydroquinate dehydratase n=1 Tax=Luteithermobacter gelatinilyticus TaxID=2582913 RepID=UPI00110581CF|nr:type II 3-dehydroquinate dehydratase [Luteithermobacter gelatinilyticus]|tara:strand:- start:23685 stop:24143 length:459 start_codon:yes stop_codon:yes gene_type:complete